MNLIEQDSILVTDEFEETDEEDSVEETIESDSDSIVTNESDDAKRICNYVTSIC